MTTTVAKTVQTFASAIQRAGIPYEKVLIFGSAVRETMNEWSDIDVAVIGPAFRSDRIDEMVDLRMIAYGIDPAMSPMPLRPDELDDQFDTIAQAVRREGQEIPITK